MPVALVDPPIPLDLAVWEQSTGSIWAALLDGDGVPFSPLLLSTLTLTLYTIRSTGLAQVINGRNDQNVLNTNGVTLFANLQTIHGRGYNLRWDFTSLDTTPVDDTLPFSRYLARFRWQWTGGIGSQTIALVIQRIFPIVPNVSDGYENYVAANYFAALGIGG